jgi:hypothetical protein
MEFTTGTAPRREHLPGSTEYWVEVRKLRRTERRRYQRLIADERGEEAVELLLAASICDFQLPSPKGAIRFSPDDAAWNAARLEEADDELESWLIEQASWVNGLDVQAKLLQLAREGVRVTPDLADELRRTSREEWDRILGNLLTSPAPTGEDPQTTTEPLANDE